MAYPLIILGAGASFDSIDFGKHTASNRSNFEGYRPPLTKDLFDYGRAIFQDLLKKYDEVGSLASRVLPRLTGNKFTFEEILQDLLDNHNLAVPGRHKDVLKELISFNFYLADLFRLISDNFFNVDNNYKRLINELQEKNIKAYVLNFNYDLIFERSLGINLKDIDSYIGGSIKILKIHGACNWHYAPLTISNNAYPDAKSYFTEAADTLFDSSFYPNEKIKADAIPENYLLGDKEGRTEAFMPALALPLNKKPTHTCPPSHVTDFEKNIDEFDRVIIIGWRGTDSFMKEKLKEKFGEKRQIPTFVITYYDSNNKGSREIKVKKEEIREQYADIPQLHILDENVFLMGFSQFMGDRDNYSRLFDDNLVKNFDPE